MPERSTEAAGAASEQDPARLADLGHRIAEWLAPRLGADGAVSIGPVTTPPLNGSSNQTLLIEATWQVDDQPTSGGFVVRMAPRGRRLYQVYDLAVQYRTMAAVSETAVPVPPLVGFEADPAVVGEPFYVMEQVRGEAPPDLPPFTVAGWVHDAPPATQAAVHDNGLAMVAMIHDLDAAAMDLRGLAVGFDDLFARTEAWCRWAAPHGNPFLTRAMRWLVDHRPGDLSPSALNWGDARPGNLLFDGTVPVAVLDWEMAAVVPPEVDLGWWIFLYRHHTDGLGVPRLPGFPTDDQVAARYEEISGRTLRHLDYFVAFAGLRFSIIVARAMDAMGDVAATVDNTSSRLLAEMTGLPAPASMLR